MLLFLIILIVYNTVSQDDISRLYFSSMFQGRNKKPFHLGHSLYSCAYMTNKKILYFYLLLSTPLLYIT